MSRRDQRKRESARRVARRGARRESVATIIQYGPDDKTVTKVVAAFFDKPGGPEKELKKWVATDITTSPKFREELAAFIDRWHPDKIGFSFGVMGCPHEEGPDYPEGGVCPICPFWATHNRWLTSQPTLIDRRMLDPERPWPG